MTPTERAELRRKAKAATPGPWRASNPTDECLDDHIIGPIGTDFVCSFEPEIGVADLEFIAAANPAVVLELLDTLDAASALKVAKEALEGAKAEWEKMTRYGSPLARQANENFQRVDTALAAIRKITGGEK